MNAKMRATVAAVALSLAGTTTVAQIQQPLVQEYSSLDATYDQESYLQSTFAIEGEQLSMYRGGAFFAPFTPNHHLIQGIGLLLTFITAPTSLIPIQPTDNKYYRVYDSLVCNGVVPFVGGTYNTRQIIRGNLDKRVLGWADSGVALGVGVLTQAASLGCSFFVSAIANSPDGEAGDVANSTLNNKSLMERSPENYGLPPGDAGRKLLAKKRDENDKWLYWATTSAENASKKYDYHKEQARYHEMNAEKCFPLPFCRVYHYYEAQRHYLDQVKYRNEFNKLTRSAGDALKTHAADMRMPTLGGRVPANGTIPANMTLQLGDR